MKILFQGDSITDAGRERGDYHDLGWGYPRYAAETIKNRHPGTEFEFINLGISGDEAQHLRARWQTDCIGFSPDVVSVMVGVNDTWHYAENQNWMPDAYFEECYRHILSEVKTKTNAKIIMLEQYLLPFPDKEFFRVDLDRKIQVTRRLAREFADVFVPLDGIFAAHCIGEEPTAWSEDGVHPNEAGARLIAAYYADAFEKLL